MENGRTWILMEETIGYHRCNLRAINKITMLINREHAVSVTIKGCTDICSGLTYLLLHIHHILWLNRASRVIGETTIQIKIQRNKLTREALKDTRHNQTRHAIT